MPDYSIDFLLEFGKNNNEKLDKTYIEKFLVIKKKNIRKKTVKYKKNRNAEHDKDFKFLLNKLCNTNIDQIYDKFNLLLNSEIEIKKFLDVIFDCSITQPNYCKLYAQLVYKFNNRNIKTLIINKCKEFYNSSDMLPISTDLANTNYIEFCRANMEKQKLIGCFNFIAELYIIKMIDESIIINYISLLTNNIKTLNEESNNKYVECYTNLLKNTYKNLKKELNSEEYLNIVNTLYNMSQDKQQFKPRYRFMLDDTYNLIK